MDEPGAGQTDAGGLQARISELESRLRDMETRGSAGGRTRRFMSRLMPPEASHHFRAAGREQLLGIRALVDFWIHRLDDQPGQSGEREDIPID